MTLTYQMYESSCAWQTWDVKQQTFMFKPGLPSKDMRVDLTYFATLYCQQKLGANAYLHQI